MGPDQYRAPDTFGTLGRDQQILALIAVVTALYAAALGGGLIPPVHAALFGFFVPLAGLAVMALILGLSVGRPWAVMTMLVVVFFGLSLSFRVRELGAVGLDWQNGVKLGCWALLCVIGLLRWRSLLPVLSLPIPASFSMASSVMVKHTAIRKHPLQSAPTISARFQPKDLSGVASFMDNCVTQ